MNGKLKGLLITTCGVLLVVPDSLFVRLISAEPMVTAFWRSLISGIFALFIVVFLYGGQGFRDVTPEEDSARLVGISYGFAQF